MKIILTGGGTGGHIVPLVVVAKKIKEKMPDAEFIYIGPRGKLELELMNKEGIATRNILVGKFRRYFSFYNFIDIFKIPIGVIQSLWWLLFYMPDAVFSKGGYASFPIVFAAWIYRIPILVHESDSVPGMANSALGKFATRVAVSYPEAEQEFSAAQVVLTGNPIRLDINKGSAENARKKFSLVESKKTIFVYGGSQGSEVMNNKIVEILPKLLSKYQIIHQTGINKYEETVKKAGEIGIKAGREGYHPIAFISDDLKDILAVADLVISRAGANSISEIAANGKVCILIPITKSANNHQRMNAYALSRIDGCFVLEESNLGENLLLSRIDELMEDENLRADLSKNIKVFYHPDAAERIADGILEMIK